MKHLLIIICLNFSIGLVAQVNPQDDWFDMNLKGKPKKVTNIYTDSLSYFTNNNHKKLKKKPFSVIGEYFFDNKGFIIKECDNYFGYSKIKCYDYRTLKRKVDKDTILFYSSLKNGGIEKKFKYILDDKGFLKSKIYYSYTGGDTIQFTRDDKNRIIKSYNVSHGVDSSFKKTNEFQYNDNNDVAFEKEQSENNFGILFFEEDENGKEVASDYKPSINKNEYKTSYKYTYDKHNNWICKIVLRDGKIKYVIYREIKY
jgi:hypothetical protein